MGFFQKSIDMLKMSQIHMDRCGRVEGDKDEITCPTTKLTCGAHMHTLYHIR